MAHKHQDQGLVDLLEIYYARSLRRTILAHLRRLALDRGGPYRDSERDLDVACCYEDLLSCTDNLLHRLGDQDQAA